MFDKKRNDLDMIQTITSPPNNLGRLADKTQKFIRRHKILSILIAAFIIFSAWFLISKTAGEIASLSLSPSSSTVTAGTNFNVAIRVDTKNNNIVAVKSVLNYNPADFQLISWDTTSSAFSASNTCVYNSKPCEIINNNTAAGSLTITLAKPSPGINTSNGLIANLTFKPLRAITPSADNLTLHYIAFNNYTDSDVILDDGDGTDILSSVTNSRITSILPVPSGLSGSGKSATEITLNWSAPASNIGIAGYKIFRNNVQVGTSATNTYTDTGLAPSTSYSYSISAFDASSHESTKTTAVSVSTLADTSAPSVPTGLAASNITMNQVSLSWNASSDNVGVTSYNVYRNNNKIGSTQERNFSDSNLAPDTTYSYQVSAVDAAGNESAKCTAITAKTAADSQAPSVPSNVTAQAVSISQINLTWVASTDNVAVTGYNVYRNGTKVGSPTSTSYNDTGLNVATTYTYKISAVDAKGNESAQSASASATTNSDTQAPTVPSGLSATPASMTQINLSWNPSTDNVNVTNYRIFRNGTQIGTSATLTYQDTGLTKSTSYSYTVSALDAAGNQSAQSAAVSATTLSDSEKPTPPGNLTATATSMTEVNLAWSASTDNIGVTGYNIYRNGVNVATTEELTYKDTGLTQDTSYSYYVTALDADNNESNQSNTATATTLTKKYGLADFINLVSDWLQTKTSPADVSNDGVIDSKDLGIMMSNWQ